jgi:TolB-like protein
MNRTLRMFAALAPLVAFAPVAAQSNAPVVAVLVFDNGSFGAGARDYDGIGKGIMDIMITDLASSSKVRVVDRERVQKILEEQNLTKSGAIDATTAVKVGKLFGACYSVYGSYMRGPNGDQMLTIHTTSNETGQIQNAIKESAKGDNVMELIANASGKFINGMNVSACTGTAGARRTGDASPAPAQQQGAQPAPAATTVQYAKQLTAAEKQKLESVKLDARTMLLYSRGLDAKDRKENARAVALFKQVKEKYPSFQPALDQLQSLNAGN